jgi:uncharacterized cupredoxin-like copper-binding protein
MHRFIRRITAVLAMGVLGACPAREGADTKADSKTSSGAGPTSVTITATDYAFEMPAQIPAGVVTFKLASRGKELHHAIVVRLDQGKTVDDMREALKQPGPPPPWARPLGGPNAPDPAGDTEATLSLAPGRYAVICFIPSPGGVPHFAKGMVAGFEATTGSGGQAEPDRDVAIELTDYSFTLSAPLTAGTHRIRVENGGPQLHEVVVAQLAPGKTAEDVTKWEAGGLKTAPPVTRFLGGASPMAPNGVVTFPVTLERGEYVLICFIPDAKDGRSHAAHGMVRQFTIN